MNSFPQIKRMGERAFLLEFDPEISSSGLQRVLSFKKYLQDNLVEVKVEIINTYNSLLINYKSPIEDAYREVLELAEAFYAANINFKFKTRLFHIPVCYDDIFGIDMEEISTEKNLSKKEIIRLHSSQNYLVYFIGFLPGFLYLGGLPESLHFSRKDRPRSKVEKGAVGIGEQQTGIYPQSSPGGWNIIGNSPIKLFDPQLSPPCEIRSGDKIKFYSVSLEEHKEISMAVEKGEFRFQIEEENG